MNATQNATNLSPSSLGKKISVMNDLTAAMRNGAAVQHPTDQERANAANLAALSNHPNPEHAMRVSRQRG